MTITSKFNSKCKKCGGTISKGEEIEWSREHGSQHGSCPVKEASSNGVNPAKLPTPNSKLAAQPQPRFHHLEKAFHKAEAAEAAEAAEKKAAQSPDHDPYWSILCQQAEHEEALCTAN
jgi:hypothetical protein